MMGPKVPRETWSVIHYAIMYQQLWSLNVMFAQNICDDSHSRCDSFFLICPTLCVTVLLCFANIIYCLFLSLRVPKESQDHLVNREPQELRWGQLVILILSLSFEIHFENVKVRDVHSLHWSLLFLFHAGNARPSGSTWTPRGESRNLYSCTVNIKLVC